MPATVSNVNDIARTLFLNDVIMAVRHNSSTNDSLYCIHDIEFSTVRVGGVIVSVDDGFGVLQDTSLLLDDGTGVLPIRWRGNVAAPLTWSWKQQQDAHQHPQHNYDSIPEKTTVLELGQFIEVVGRMDTEGDIRYVAADICVIVIDPMGEVEQWLAQVVLYKTLYAAYGDGGAEVKTIGFGSDDDMDMDFDDDMFATFKTPPIVSGRSRMKEEDIDSLSPHRANSAIKSLSFPPPINVSGVDVLKKGDEHGSDIAMKACISPMSFSGLFSQNEPTLNICELTDKVENYICQNGLVTLNMILRDLPGSDEQLEEALDRLRNEGRIIQDGSQYVISNKQQT